MSTLTSAHVPLLRWENTGHFSFVFWFFTTGRGFKEKNYNTIVFLDIHLSLSLILFLNFIYSGVVLSKFYFYCSFVIISNVWGLFCVLHHHFVHVCSRIELVLRIPHCVIGYGFRYRSTNGIPALTKPVTEALPLPHWRNDIGWWCPIFLF